MPDSQNFPFGVWGRLLARRATFGADMLFGTYHVTGLPALKEAIAGYLISARGVRCSPEQIVVTTGAQAAFDLLARLLLDPGDTVWLEEPGYYAAKATFTVAGANILPLVVDRDGWQMNQPEVSPRWFQPTTSMRGEGSPARVLCAPTDVAARIARNAERARQFIGPSRSRQRPLTPGPLP